MSRTVEMGIHVEILRAALTTPMLIGAGTAAYVFCVESRHDPPRGVGGWARRSMWGVGYTMLGAVVGGVATAFAPLWAPVAAVEGLRRWGGRATDDKATEATE